MGSSQTRARTHVPCIDRWILNHCATREAQSGILYSCFHENGALVQLAEDSRAGSPSDNEQSHCGGLAGGVLVKLPEEETYSWGCGGGVNGRSLESLMIRK